jgi:hypothetical protein
MPNEIIIASELASNRDRGRPQSAAQVGGSGSTIRVGVIVGVLSAGNGYEVQFLNDENEGVGPVFSRVHTVPDDASFLAGDRVLLLSGSTDAQPWIMATGAGGGSPNVLPYVTATANTFGE